MKGCQFLTWHTNYIFKYAFRRICVKSETRAVEMGVVGIFMFTTRIVNLVWGRAHIAPQRTDLVTPGCEIFNHYSMA